VTYREAVAWIYALQLHGIKLGLENMQRLCAALGLRVAGEGAPSFLHVAGTNGKGSVCAMLAAIYRAAGLRSGLYTSPHLVTFRERIRLDGEMISEHNVAEGLSRIRAVVADWNTPPTFFEVTTALALRWFQDQQAQVVVLETGLGGRLDATNVVTPAVSVLTPISHDHERYLGTTLPEIAAEKCGIIKAGVPVVSAAQAPEAWQVIERVAQERGAPLHRATGVPADFEVNLPGEHQRQNAGLAWLVAGVAASAQPLLEAGASVSPDVLRTVSWPGRFQRIGEDLVLDGAHNPGAAATLATTWREVFGEQKATLILGVMRDKDAPGICAALAPVAARVFAVKVGNARSHEAAELAALARGAMPGVPVEVGSSLRETLATARGRGSRVLVAGSLFLVGEALVALGLAEGRPEASEQ
jgi:dihydrofolate synthase/folylpolyglutamate synthase